MPKLRAQAADSALRAYLRALAVAIVATVIGCAQPVGFTAEVVTAKLTTAPVGVHEDDCLRVFTPDAETEAYVAEAVDRWSEATGCTIRIGDGGMPVIMVDSVFLENGDQGWGVTRLGADGPTHIEISRTAPPYTTTSHEVGHVLAWPYVDLGDHHSETGVMASPITTDEIDDSSLSLICASLPCREFNLLPSTSI